MRRVIEEQHQREWDRGNIRDLLTDDEQAAYDWIEHFVRRHGRLPSWEALSHEEALRALTWPSTTDPATYWRERVMHRAFIIRSNAAVRETMALLQSGAHQTIGPLFQRVGRDLVRLGDVEASVSLAALETDELNRLDRLRFGAIEIVPSGFEAFDRQFGGWVRGDFNVIAGRLGVGKALALDTPLPTPTGWTTMGEVQTGDFLVGSDGIPVKVVATSPVMTGRPCYRVEFSDGSSIVADENHEWLTSTHAARRSALNWPERYLRVLPSSIDQRHKAIRPSVVTTKQILQTLRCRSFPSQPVGQLNHSIAVCKPLKLPETSLPVPPYLLGLWLGDGTTCNGTFTSADPELVGAFEQAGYRVVKYVHPPSRVAAMYRFNGTSTTKPFVTILRQAGILGKKQIPGVYLRSSEEQRRALLAGLLDTDGTVTLGGSIQFYSTRKALALGVLELVSTLGYRARISQKPVRGKSAESSICYTVTFSTPDKVFRLKRKALAHLERRAGPSVVRSNKRYITNVVPVKSAPVRCVQVDADDHLYLAGRSFVPTHNSYILLKSVLAAARAGERVLVASMEMPSSAVWSRSLALAGAESAYGMNSRAYLLGQVSQWGFERARQDAEAARPVFERVHLLTGQFLRSIDSIAAEVDRLRPGIVFIDGIRFLNISGKFQSAWEKTAALADYAKMLAMEYHVPVIVAVQMGRPAAGRKRGSRGPEHLAGSDVIGQNASVIWDVTIPKRHDGEDDVLKREIHILKGRDGEVGSFLIAYEADHAYFAPIESGRSRRMVEPDEVVDDTT